MKDHCLLQSASTDIFCRECLHFVCKWWRWAPYLCYPYLPFYKDRAVFCTVSTVQDSTMLFSVPFFSLCCRTSKLSPELCFVPSPRMPVTANEHLCASVGCQCPWGSGVRVGWPSSIDMSLQKRSPYIEYLTETTNRHVSSYSCM
jgi:hypothetical protein